MDDLSALIHQLQKEVSELEQALRLRDAEEAASLKVEAARLQTAQARMDRARQTLAQEASALAAVNEQRKDLLKRIESWQGQLWRIGFGSVATVMIPATLTAMTLAWAWLPGRWGVGLIAVQAALFAALFFLIPEKR